MNNIKPNEIDVVVLCGGEGKRLGDLTTNRPKPMIKIKNRIFLDILIEYFALFGFRHFILCVGYKSKIIKGYYENKKNHLIYSISEEKDLLGTAGALKNASELIKSKTFLVLNGDSLCRVDVKKFLQFHLIKKATASIALVESEDTQDYGLVTLNDEQQVVRFDEKKRNDKPGLISAGIYFINTEVLGHIPSGEKFPLEYQIFPSLLNKGLYGYSTTMHLFDIGTPEKLKVAMKNL